MSSPSLVFVLAEDRRQQNFARGLLKEAGFDKTQIRFSSLPTGRGAGEQFVREHYPDELKAVRRRAARAATALLVIIDADRRQTAEVRDCLRRELANGRIDPPDQEERVGVLVPRRHIETWVVVLRGEGTDEEEDCKSRVSDSELQGAGGSFAHVARSSGPPPANWLPSMKDSVSEARKVLPG